MYLRILYQEQTRKDVADFLTFSRVIFGLIVLSLSLIGKSAYVVVVILTLVGAATDMLDGKIVKTLNKEGFRTANGER